MADLSLVERVGLIRDRWDGEAGETLRSIIVHLYDDGANIKCANEIDDIGNLLDSLFFGIKDYESMYSKSIPIIRRMKSPEEIVGSIERYGKGLLEYLGASNLVGLNGETANSINDTVGKYKKDFTQLRDELIGYLDKIGNYKISPSPVKVAAGPRVHTIAVEDVEGLTIHITDRIYDTAPTNWIDNNQDIRSGEHVYIRPGETINISGKTATVHIYSESVNSAAETTINFNENRVWLALQPRYRNAIKITGGTRMADFYTDGPLPENVKIDLVISPENVFYHPINEAPEVSAFGM